MAISRGRTPGRTGGGSTGRRSVRRRAAMAMVLIALFVGLFAVRLFDLQVVQAQTLNAAAEDNRSVPLKILGMRGDIYDATGVVLAHSVLRYDITASPKAAVGPSATPEIAAAKLAETRADATRIAAITGQNPDDIVAALTDAVAADSAADYAYVVKQVDVETFEAIKALDIPWVYYEAHPARTYPDGAVAGNLVGYVGAANEAQAGVELSEDSCLAASDGTETYERSEDGVRIPGSTVETVAAVDGSDVVLTIDADLQWFVQQTLAKYAQEYGAGWGTVVVQEVRTGKLLAVADYPSVDPNNVDATAASDAGSRAFTAPFEPGSTFKTLTAASLIDSGQATPLSHVLAPYRITDDGVDINDSESHGTWRLTLTGVLKESSNTGMSRLGQLLSPQQRLDYMTAFHLGTTSEVGFPGEEPGYLGDNAPDWNAQTDYATTFGQGLTTTAIQTASIYQAIGNGGVRMPVSLVSGCRAADGTITDAPATAGSQVVSPQAARETVDMLENVATKGWLASRIAIPGYRIATKTGTAQHSDGNGDYADTFNVSLAGLAPAEDPQYVVSVSLGDPVRMNNSGATAPIFREVMAQVLKQFQVIPSGSSSPDIDTDW
ncbi:peptidoglycan D,D-transpeptidase FtsI family protein [Naasia lichenicola]|uniref:Penicillin-binding protein 2 n=1 Tax=Naasia lichenicola TaxID=2565933 RepID=A0A4V3WTY3_9MICO|nr:penicillin-binding protein 2 [Naasia lichenicola]THG33467.1 penicillin-binding protein 2 [Naasia lichenicola]